VIIFQQGQRDDGARQDGKDALQRGALGDHGEGRLGRPILLLTFGKYGAKLAARFAPLPPSSHTTSAALGWWNTLKPVTNRGNRENL